MNFLQRLIRGRAILLPLAILLLAGADRVLPEGNEEAPMEGMNASGEFMTPLEAMLAAGEMAPMEGMNAPGVDVMAGMAELSGQGPPGSGTGAGVNLQEEEREDFIRERMQDPNNGANRGRAPVGGS